MACTLGLGAYFMLGFVIQPAVVLIGNCYTFILHLQAIGELILQPFKKTDYLCARMCV